MAVKLYTLAISPPCRAVIMTAKVLGVELEKSELDLWNGAHLKPEFVKINPQHMVPTIDDNGFILWESRAILTYLANKYAPDSSIYPKDPQERAVVDRMLFFDIGTLYKSALEYFRSSKAKSDVQKEKEAWEKALDFLEKYLAKSPYVAGDHLTLADISILASVTITEVLDYSFSAYPKIDAWIKKLKLEIPSYSEINDIPINQFKEKMKQDQK